MAAAPLVVVSGLLSDGLVVAPLVVICSGLERQQTNSSGLSKFEEESDVSPCTILKRHPYSVKKAMLAY
eukprot:481491-Pelagomonas_calceolata.AAC.1